MKIFYFVLYEDIIKEVGDLTQAVVLCKILNYAHTNHTATPAFQQSYLAAILSLSTDTVGRSLKELEEKGFVHYQAKGYGTYRTTEFTITEKTHKIIKGDKSHTLPKQLSEEEKLTIIASESDKESIKRRAAELDIDLTPEKITKIKNIKRETQTVSSYVKK